MVRCLQQKAVLIAAAVALVIIGLVASVVLVLKSRHKLDEGCQIYPFINHVHPLIVLSNTSSLIYPERGSKQLVFNKHQAVDLVCPGRAIFLGSTWSNNTVTRGYCKQGREFTVDNVVVDWSNLRCSNSLWRDIRDTNSTCAGINSTILESGYVVGDGRFINTLTICFNKAQQIAHWTFINQTASINQQVVGTPRPSWLQGSGIYTIGSVNNMYLRRKQRSTINSLLGLENNSTKYIQDSSNLFLARGHLTARSDGFYAAQQNSTFFMQNIAPQWQSFNGFNWNQIEMNVRDYGDANGVDLRVWTGVHGIATLPHETTSEPIELYLFVNSTTKALPVPEIFYKVVQDPSTEKGVVLIGVNNPYLSNFTLLCPDVSASISWLHFDKSNQQMGYCYACRISSFRYAVASLPNIVDRGLLV